MGRRVRATLVCALVCFFTLQTVAAGVPPQRAFPAPPPLPLVSRGVPAFASAGTASGGNDASYGTYWRSGVIPSATAPQWLAYDLSSVPAARRGTVYVGWYNEATYPYDSSYGNAASYTRPTDYEIQANAASGGSPPTGGWVTLVAVAGNTLHSRSHLLELSGYNWIRFICTKGGTAAQNLDVSLQSFDVHDASGGVFDAWKFFGDSITAGGMGHSASDNFAQLVNLRVPNFPAFENAGMGGWRTDTLLALGPDGRSYIDSWLSNFPGRYVGLSMGTNDSTAMGDQAFHDNYVKLVEKVLALGKVPVIPTIPWARNPWYLSAIPAKNAVLDQVITAYGGRVLRGPDLWTFFKTNQNLISSDDLHPSAAGYAGMRQQWASAMLATVYGDTTVPTPPPALPTPIPVPPSQPPIQVPSTLGPLPAAWPRTLELGLVDESGGGAGLRASAPFGFRYHYLAGGVNTGGGWATWNPDGAYVSSYIADSLRYGLIPVFSYYQLQQTPDYWIRPLANAATMQAYFKDVRLFMQRAGAFAGSPVVLHVEPDLWGYVQQQNNSDDAQSRPAMTASSGLSELAGLPDDVRGFAQAFVRLRDLYAPNVILGYHLSPWGTNKDILFSKPSDATLDAMATRSAAFYYSLAANFDVVFAEYSDRDAAFKQYVDNESGWWYAPADYNRNLRYLARFASLTQKRIVLWQIPLGNTRMRAVNNSTGHYQDNKVEYLLDDPTRVSLSAHIYAGVIAFLFGGGATGTTCACDAMRDGITNPAAINGNDRQSLNSDDDGGFFRERAAAYYLTGPIALPSGAGAASPAPTVAPTAAPTAPSTSVPSAAPTVAPTAPTPPSAPSTASVPPSVTAGGGPTSPPATGGSSPVTVPASPDPVVASTFPAAPAPAARGPVRTPVPIEQLTSDPVTTATATTLMDGYHSQWIEQTAPGTLAPEQIVEVTMRIQNRGTIPWVRGATGGEVRLGIVGDAERYAHLGMREGWIAADRLTTTVEPIVGPGEIGTFVFKLRAPKDVGTYRLDLRPVADGASWLTDEGIHVEFQVSDAWNVRLGATLSSFANTIGTAIRSFWDSLVSWLSEVGQGLVRAIRGR